MPAHHGRFIACYRVPTDRQGKSGLGLEAQKAAVADRLNGGRWQIVEEFTETESGKRTSRPQLDAALAACKKYKAKLIVTKLDRLSRNVSFGNRERTSAGLMGMFALPPKADILRVEINVR